jgi:hypothetical protein
MSDCTGLLCSKDSLLSVMRENLADCDEPYTWSDNYLNTAIQLAISKVVGSNKEEFTAIKNVTLQNGECIQSVCDVCEGIVDFPANVNGNCSPPKDEVNYTDQWLNKMYGSVCSNEQADYKIESIEIIGDGGCQFRVTPAVPKTGTYILPVACVESPCIDDEIPPALCRHWSEVFYLAMGVAYMLEDDRNTLNKAQIWFELYFKMVQVEREADRDVFVESIKFGTRINTDDE